MNTTITVETAPNVIGNWVIYGLVLLGIIIVVGVVFHLINKARG